MFIHAFGWEEEGGGVVLEQLGMDGAVVKVSEVTLVHYWHMELVGDKITGSTEQGSFIVCGLEGYIYFFIN